MDLRLFNNPFSAEDASGPTTTCDITTFDPEPLLELEFDDEKWCATDSFLDFSLLSDFI